MESIPTFKFYSYTEILNLCAYFASTDDVMKSNFLRKEFVPEFDELVKQKSLWSFLIAGLSVYNGYQLDHCNHYHINPQQSRMALRINFFEAQNLLQDNSQDKIKIALKLTKEVFDYDIFESVFSNELRIKIFEEFKQKDYTQSSFMTKYKPILFMLINRVLSYRQNNEDLFNEIIHQLSKFALKNHVLMSIDYDDDFDLNFVIVGHSTILNNCIDINGKQIPTELIRWMANFCYFVANKPCNWLYLEPFVYFQGDSPANTDTPDQTIQTIYNCLVQELA